MKKILFLCHGNICRSPMAELVFKDLIKKQGIEHEFQVDSAAMTREELGNPVYPPARKVLQAHGIDPSGKYARLITRDDYDRFDMLICMDDENLRDMKRMFGNMEKVSLLMSYAGETRGVADPWWTGDFDTTWNDIYNGCTALLEKLKGEIR